MSPILAYRPLHFEDIDLSVIKHNIVSDPRGVALQPILASAVVRSTRQVSNGSCSGSVGSGEESDTDTAEVDPFTGTSAVQMTASRTAVVHGAQLQFHMVVENVQTSPTSEGEGAGAGEDLVLDCRTWSSVRDCVVYSPEPVPVVAGSVLDAQVVVRGGYVWMPSLQTSDG